MIVLKLTICVAYISLRCVNSQRNALHMKATGGLFYAYARRRIDSRAIHIVTTYYMPLLFVLKKKMAPKVNINVEKLISLIEINPVIYDKKDRDHKDINVLRNVWESIASAMQITDCKFFFFSSD